MGGAQPLAATLNGAVFLGIDVDPARIERRVRTGYCDRIAMTLDEALDICEDARDRKRAGSLTVGLIGNCAEVLPELVRRGVKVDAVTDQTSAHDPLNGYVPARLSLDEAATLRGKGSCCLRREIDGADGATRRSNAGVETLRRGGV